MGEITGSRRRLSVIFALFFLEQIKKNGAKCSAFTTCSPLICPKHAIPFHIPQRLQLKKKKKKKNSLLLQVLSFPQNCLSFFYFLPPSHHQLISDMPSPLFSSSSSFLRLVGCDSVHLIKMYIFKSFFKGKVFV